MRVRRTDPTSITHAQTLVYDTEYDMARRDWEPRPELEDEMSYLGRLWQYIAANGTESERTEAKQWLESEER